MISSKIGHKTPRVASAVWHVAPSCWNQMLPIFSTSIFVNKCSDNDLHWLQRPLFSDFRRKMSQLCLWTKILTKQWLVLDASAFQCMRTGFLRPKCDNFACLHTRQDQNELYMKKWFFFPKSGSSINRLQVHLSKRSSSAYTTIFVRWKDKTNYLSNQTWTKCYHSRNKY